MHSIIQQTMHTRSHVHIPGSDMNGRPMATFAPTSAERKFLSPNVPKPKIKIERKKA